MPIIFPRDIPTELIVAGLSMRLEGQVEISPSRGGTQYAADLGPALWFGEWQSDRLNPERLGEVRAWFNTLRSLNAFYGYDKLREFPYAYRNTGWTGLTVEGSPFDGTCTLAAVESNNVEISLSDLPDGFTLTPGDYLHFDYGSSSRALHMIVAGGDADGNGDLDIEVRPQIRPGYTISPATTVTLEKPAAKMIIVPDSYRDPVDSENHARVTFQAKQTL